MATRFRFNVQPSFYPGERVLFTKNWLWFLSCKALPTYRVVFPLPPLCQAGMYVTDRRVLIVFPMLGLASLETDAYFSGAGEPREKEILKGVTCGRNWLLGPYLQIMTEDSQVHWYSFLPSPVARFRIYMKNPERISLIICDAMKAAHGRYSPEA